MVEDIDDIEENESDPDGSAAFQAAIAQKIGAMLNSEGWAHLKSDFLIRADNLQDDVNVVGGNEMVYTKKDIKIIELNLLRDIMNYPERYLLMLKQERQPVEQMDPNKNKFEN